MKPRRAPWRKVPPPTINLLRDVATPQPCFICAKCGRLVTTALRTSAKMRRAMHQCPECGERQDVLPKSGVIRLDPWTYEAIAV